MERLTQDPEARARLQAAADARHEENKASHGRFFVEAAMEQLYFCRMQCLADNYPWPEDLDTAHHLLWQFLGLDPALRRLIMALD